MLWRTEGAQGWRRKLFGLLCGLNGKLKVQKDRIGFYLSGVITFEAD